MAHTFASLEKLEKSDLARLAMNHQNKFDTVLNNISYELLDLKNNLSQIGKFPEMLIITTILSKIFGTKQRNPVKLDRTRKV